MPQRVTFTDITANGCNEPIESGEIVIQRVTFTELSAIGYIEPSEPR